MGRKCRRRLANFVGSTQLKYFAKVKTLIWKKEKLNRVLKLGTDLKFSLFLNNEVRSFSPERVILSKWVQWYIFVVQWKFYGNIVLYYMKHWYYFLYEDDNFDSLPYCWVLDELERQHTRSIFFPLLLLWFMKHFKMLIFLAPPRICIGNTCCMCVCVCGRMILWRGLTVDMIVGKNHIITTVDLTALNFKGFLSYILYEIQSNGKYSFD